MIDVEITLEQWQRWWCAYAETAQSPFTGFSGCQDTPVAAITTAILWLMPQIWKAAPSNTASA